MNNSIRWFTHVLIFVFLFTLPTYTKKIESSMGSGFGGKIIFFFDECTFGSIIQVGTSSYMHLLTTKDYDREDPGYSSIGQWILGKTLVDIPLPCIIEEVPVYFGKPIKFNGTSG